VGANYGAYSLGMRKLGYKHRIVAFEPLSSAFAQLKNDQLLTILKDAKIIKLKKDQILFSQEQKVENFYIVLDGLVKLSRLNSKGSEAIIKIIDIKATI
jgi:FkbM family methyltransferase